MRSNLDEKKSINESKIEAKQGQSLKLLMIDHGGVLDYTSRNSNPEALRQTMAQFYLPEQVDELVLKCAGLSTDFDLTTGEMEDGNYIVMPDGAKVIRALSRLSNELGFQLVFHSKNSLADQFALVKKLSQEIDKHNKTNQQETVTLPSIAAFVAVDSVTTNMDPKKCIANGAIDAIEKFETAILKLQPSYELNTIPAIQDAVVLKFNNKAPDDGKRLVREAIAAYYGIQDCKEAHQAHYVLDDGSSNIREALKEGYQGIRIGEPSDNNGVSLLNALENIIAKELKARLAATTETDVTKASANQAALFSKSSASTSATPITHAEIESKARLLKSMSHQ